MNTMSYIDYLTEDFDPSEYDESDMILCPECGEEMDELDRQYYGMHENCYVESMDFEKSLTVENALKCESDTVELPNFLTFIYDPEQIKDILLAHFMELDNKDELIKDYALEDVSEWAERTNNG